jgi:hypothetical protein
VAVGVRSSSLACGCSRFQEVEHLLHYLLRRESIGAEVEVAVFARVRQATMLLFQVLRAEPEGEASAGDCGKVGVQVNQPDRAGNAPPHVRHVGVLLRAVTRLVPQPTQPACQRGFAGRTRSHNGDSLLLA